MSGTHFGCEPWHEPSALQSSAVRLPSNFFAESNHCWKIFSTVALIFTSLPIVLILPCVLHNARWLKVLDCIGLKLSHLVNGPALVEVQLVFRCDYIIDFLVSTSELLYIFRIASVLQSVTLCGVRPNFQFTIGVSLISWILAVHIVFIVTSCDIVVRYIHRWCARNRVCANKNLQCVLCLWVKTRVNMTSGVQQIAHEKHLQCQNDSREYLINYSIRLSR